LIELVISFSSKVNVSLIYVRALAKHRLGVQKVQHSDRRYAAQIRARVSVQVKVWTQEGADKKAAAEDGLIDLAKSLSALIGEGLLIYNLIPVLLPNVLYTPLALHIVRPRTSLPIRGIRLNETGSCS
jgi:hypothetical protein